MPRIVLKEETKMKKILIAIWVIVSVLIVGWWIWNSIAVESGWNKIFKDVYRGVQPESGDSILDWDKLYDDIR